MAGKELALELPISTGRNSGKLPKPWSELRQELRDEVAAKAREIHACDGDQLMRVGGRWEVVKVRREK